MLKTISQLEHVIENRAFKFLCDHDAPISFVKEALFQFQKYIGQLEDQAKAQQEQAAAQITQTAVVPIPSTDKVESIQPETTKEG